MGPDLDRKSLTLAERVCSRAKGTSSGTECVWRDCFP